MKFVIDMMGGDFGSKTTVAALLRFKQDYPNVTLYAVGKKEELKALENVAEIIDARDVLKMDAGPLDALRSKESSMLKAINLTKELNADALISAGGTAAFLSGATVRIKLIPGVERAALLAPFPTEIKGKYVAILDIGASSENTANHLYQFAKMGQIYANSVFNLANPKTYLLNNGTEDTKGTALHQEAHKLFKARELSDFYGNIEAREVLSGDADVVVADGFSGNIFLKATEGAASVLMGGVKKAFMHNALTKLGYLFAKRGFKELATTFDYKNTGGAILLGVNNVVIKAHGNSDERGFYSALIVAQKMAAAKIVETVKKGLTDEEKV